jgi:hypothetical protein
MAGNPLSGLLGGSGSSAPKDKWSDLDQHQKASIFGQASDIYLQWLGRQPTMKEAEAWYSAGQSAYGLQTALIMSKEFLHTGIYRQYQRKYAFAIEQFFGAGFKLKPKMIQSFTAHGYDTTDIQAWIYRHPKVYMQSNDYKDRVSQFYDIYQQSFGVDPAARIAGQEDVRQRVDTNKKRPGVQGHSFNTVTIHPDDPLLKHAQQAALHFATPGQYQSWLHSTQAYQAHAQAQVQGQQSDAGLQLDQNGRPVQQGLGGGNRSRADIPV